MDKIRLIAIYASQANVLGNAHTRGKQGTPAPPYLDKALELRVLLQESSLLLLKREDVFCCLLENGCLRARGKESG